MAAVSGAMVPASGWATIQESILLEIAAKLPPEDAARLAKTCRAFRNTIIVEYNSVKSLISRDWEMLKVVASEHRASQELVLIGIKQPHSKALELAAPELQNDEKCKGAAEEQKGIDKAADKAADMALVLAAVSQNGFALRFTPYSDL